MRRSAVFTVGAALVLSAHVALAQPDDRTVVAFAAGGSTGEQQTGGAFGGTLVVNINDWVAVEGIGIYFDRGQVGR